MLGSRGARAAFVAGGLSLGALGCVPGPAQPPPLELERFQQAYSEAVCLDETLVFHFSRPLEPTSVTSGSVFLVDERGEPARGELRVDRLTITFRPDLPLERDLSDGGLEPGTTYRVELGGFPRPDGILAQDGAPLSSTLSMTFRTADAGDPALFGEAFDDRRPLLHLARREYGSLEPIELVCEGDGLDPRTLAVGEFAIQSLDVAGGEAIAMVPRLVENRADGARLALFPLRGESEGELRVLEPGRWHLARVGHGLRGLGQRPVSLLGTGPRQPILVRARRVRSEEITFQGSSRRWGAEPEGFDGTAHWPDHGSGVDLRYPAAAGDGRAGRVDDFAGWSAEHEGPRDLHATRLVLPAGRVADLGSAGGAVLLRSQGTIEIDGRLLRPAPLEPRESGPLLAGLEQAAERQRPAWETVSAWIERALASDEPWTILVAGGEIRIRGELEVAGPLMLIAGGWVRVSGYVEAGSVWKSPEGGGNLQRVSDAPLRIDPPVRNELLRPLRVGILTNPIRPAGGVDAWLSAVVTLHRGGGAAQVRFVGLRDRPGSAETDEYDPVEDLALLEGCQAVRLLVTLEMPAGDGEPWDAPRVEAVDLSWSEIPTGAEPR